jgi:hypothetical protein
MIDPDRYWAASAASGLLAGNNSSPPPETKPASNVTAEQIDGGCLLYRLPAARRRDTDPNESAHDRAASCSSSSLLTQLRVIAE